MERKVRRLLNEQTDESHREAWQILTAISPQKRSAEWYFLSGCLRHRLGYLTDAEFYLEKAVELSHGSIPEYQTMKETLLNPNAIHFADPDSMAGVEPASKGSMFVGCMEECFIEGCGECCCECCGEGCCEGICEGLCDGCDCG